MMRLLHFCRMHYWDESIEKWHLRVKRGEASHCSDHIRDRLAERFKAAGLEDLPEQQPERMMPIEELDQSKSTEAKDGHGCYVLPITANWEIPRSPRQRNPAVSLIGRLKQAHDGESERIIYLSKVPEILTGDENGDVSYLWCKIFGRQDKERRTIKARQEKKMAKPAEDFHPIVKDQSVRKSQFAIDLRAHWYLGFDASISGWLLSGCLLSSRSIAIIQRRDIDALIQSITNIIYRAGLSSKLIPRLLESSEALQTTKFRTLNDMLAKDANLDVIFERPLAESPVNVRITPALRYALHIFFGSIGRYLQRRLFRLIAYTLQSDETTGCDCESCTSSLDKNSKISGSVVRNAKNKSVIGIPQAQKLLPSGHPVSSLRGPDNVLRALYVSQLRALDRYIKVWNEYGRFAERQRAQLPSLSAVPWDFMSMDLKLDDWMMAIILRYYKLETAQYFAESFIFSRPERSRILTAIESERIRSRSVSECVHHLPDKEACAICTGLTPVEVIARLLATAIQKLRIDFRFLDIQETTESAAKRRDCTPSTAEIDPTGNQRIEAIQLEREYLYGVREKYKSRLAELQARATCAGCTKQMKSSSLHDHETARSKANFVASNPSNHQASNRNKNTGGKLRSPAQTNGSPSSQAGSALAVSLDTEWFQQRYRQFHYSYAIRGVRAEGGYVYDYGRNEPAWDCLPEKCIRVALRFAVEWTAARSVEEGKARKRKKAHTKAHRKAMQKKEKQKGGGNVV